MTSVEDQEGRSVIAGVRGLQRLCWFADQLEGRGCPLSLGLACRKDPGVKP